MAKNYNVLWAKTANEDLVEFIQFINLDNPNAVKNTLNKIKKKLFPLDSFPQRGRVVPELKEQGVFNIKNKSFSHGG